LDESENGAMEDVKTPENEEVEGTEVDDSSDRGDADTVDGEKARSAEAREAETSRGMSRYFSTRRRIRSCM